MVEKKKKQIKKEVELAISRKNVQRLSAEIAFVRDVLRRVVKAATEKGIEIKLSPREREKINAWVKQKLPKF